MSAFLMASTGGLKKSDTKKICEKTREKGEAENGAWKKTFKSVGKQVSPGYMFLSCGQ